MKVAQLLALQGLWWHQVCRDTDCLHRRSYGPVRVFFQASCSWQSESFFGQSFSIALPIQALRGGPLPGVLLCCSARQTHKGTPLARGGGGRPVNWHIRHLKGHPGGVLLCKLAHQALRGAPWVGSCSVVQWSGI